MNRKLPTLIAAGLSTLGLSLSAHAADGTWQFTEAGDAPARVFAQDVGGPSLSLVCSDRFGVQAFLYLNGSETGELNIGRRTRLNSRNVEIASESTAAKSASWGYIRPSKLLISSKSWQGRRLFNSVVKGEPVTLSISRIGDYTLEMPAVDEQFTAFANSCDATKPS